MGYNFGCMIASLILGVGFRGQAIRWRHSRFRGSKGCCHGNPWQPFLAFYIWGAYWRHLKNTTEPSMCGGDAALCQIIWPLVTIIVFSHFRYLWCPLLTNTFILFIFCGDAAKSLLMSDKSPLEISYTLSNGHGAPDRMVCSKAAAIVRGDLLETRCP